MIQKEPNLLYVLIDLDVNLALLSTVANEI